MLDKYSDGIIGGSCLKLAVSVPYPETVNSTGIVVKLEEDRPDQESNTFPPVIRACKIGFSVCILGLASHLSFVPRSYITYFSETLIPLQNISPEFEGLLLKAVGVVLIMTAEL
jgi:hypothetical protein